jgi:hypothetical protein
MKDYKPRNPSIFRTTEIKDGYIRGIQDGMTFLEGENGTRIMQSEPLKNNYRTVRDLYQKRI